LIDVADMGGKDPLVAYQEIRHELEMYDKIKQGEEGFEALTARPELVVLNKIDAIDEATLRGIRGGFKKLNLEVMEISAATGKNIKAFVDVLGKRVFSEKQ